jgi:hypothetical protein
MSLPSYSDPPFACPPDVSTLGADYARLKNVWKVGALHGIKGSTVHSRLRRAGLLQPRAPEFTEAQIARIHEYYATTPELHFDLQVLANELGKSRQNICRKARRLGLSDKSRPENAEGRARARLPKWQDKPHPRGMAGKKHTPEVCRAMGEASRRNWATWKTFGIGRMSPENRAATSKRMRIVQATRPASTNYTRTKGGHREDLGGIYFRSSWEANYARYLNLLIKMKVVQSWEFEPETFWFEGVKRGAVSYKPDFKVYYRGDEKPEYVEIKGWEVAKDRTKWRRMKKYHPRVKLVIVGAKEYRSLAAKWSAAIPNWERPVTMRDIVRHVDEAAE